MPIDIHKTPKQAPAPGVSRAATPMAFVHAIIKAYARYGMDPSQALAQAQITPESVPDPGARVTAAQFEALSAFAMQQLDDEALGWFSRRLPWGTYGMLARASLYAPTLGVALKRWCRHHKLIVDDLILTLSVAGDTATLSITEIKPLGDSREFCLVSTLRFVHGYACWLLNSRITLREACFPYAAPVHADSVQLMFPGPVRFDAANAGFSFDSRYLDLPPARDEAAARAMLQRALPLTVRQYTRDRLLVPRVRELLRTRPAETAQAEGLADLLNMSRRTLHRQLAEEGASLQALKNEVRHELAKNLLRQTQKPIKQIAVATGFSNEKSFLRAFRQWTGETPGDFRRRSA